MPSNWKELHVPAILEACGIPYTGARVLTQALCLDKAMAKRVLSTHGIPTPPFQVFHSPRERRNPRLKFPLFVKPNREGSGMGVTPKSIVHDETELRASERRHPRARSRPAFFLEGQPRVRT